MAHVQFFFRWNDLSSFIIKDKIYFFPTFESLQQAENGFFVVSRAKSHQTFRGGIIPFGWVNIQQAWQMPLPFRRITESPTAQKIQIKNEKLKKVANKMRLYVNEKEKKPTFNNIHMRSEFKKCEKIQRKRKKSFQTIVAIFLFIFFLLSGFSVPCTFVRIIVPHIAFSNSALDYIPSHLLPFSSLPFSRSFVRSVFFLLFSSESCFSFIFGQTICFPFLREFSFGIARFRSCYLRKKNVPLKSGKCRENETVKERKK